jgi:hypothetical protein
MITTKKQKQMIKDAFRKFGNEIKPIGDAKSFCDPRCFSRGFGRILGGKLLFWFETKDGSSHIITEGAGDENKLPN